MSRKFLSLIAVAAMSLSIGSTVLAGNGNGHDPVTICHKPGTPAEHTITVDDSSLVQAHLRHGDTLGPCEPTASDEPTDDPSEEPSIEPWPCRLAGWEVGTHWGPGPLDIVPDVPVCPSDDPGASDPPADPVADPGQTPPPTDTE